MRASVWIVSILSGKRLVAAYGQSISMTRAAWPRSSGFAGCFHSAADVCRMEADRGTAGIP